MSRVQTPLRSRQVQEGSLISDFVIEEILGTEEFETANGAFVAYKVRFSGDQGNGEAQHNRKASSPAPVPGETIDAEIQHRNGRAILKRLYKPPGGQSGGGSKGGNDYRTPQQIMRSDAHGKAMHWCDIKVAAGEWNPITWEQYIAMVDRYYDDIKEAA